MKRFSTLFAALLIVCATTAQDYNIKSGDPISIRLISAIDSDSNIQTTPTAIVDANVTDNEGNILIRRGTNVSLSTDITKRKGLGKAGSINVNCLTTTAVDGQTIYLMGGISAYGEDREELAIGLGIGAGILVFPFGLFCLCIKGEDAHIPSNTIITNVVMDDNYTINY